MSNKLYQNIITQMSEFIDFEVGIIDNNGICIACTDGEKIGNVHFAFNNIKNSNEMTIRVDEYLFKRIITKSRLECITYIHSNATNAEALLSLVTLNFISAKTHHDEKHEKSSFFKGLLLGTIPKTEISDRAKELHVNINSPRVVFHISMEETKDTEGIYVHEVLEGIFPNRSRDTIIELDDKNIILVKELKQDYSQVEIDNTAKVIFDTIGSELMLKIKIGIGVVTDYIMELESSIKGAQLALIVGKIFEPEKTILRYSELGIGRLIYHLPVELCEEFLYEIFEDHMKSGFDSETMLTIQKFFENNLNVSETSRQLFVHRNTLAYRLDKIQKQTGLDLRRFDDSVIFKVALLVRRYLDKESKIV